MQNGISKDTNRKPASLYELSFADIAKMRRDREKSDKKLKNSETAKPEQIQERPPVREELLKQEEGIIVELSDKIDIKANYYKIPNDLFKIAPLQDPKEYCVYTYLYRLSYGWKRNFCRVGYGSIVKNTSLSSRSSAIRAIEGLLGKKHIIRIEEKSLKRSGTLYRVLTPQEILSGVFTMSVVKLSIVRMTISKETILKTSIINPDTHYSQNDHSSKSCATKESTTVFNMSIVKTRPNKDINKDNLKNTLSLRDIISGFYKGIGQEKISKTKRERADKSFKELHRDGFSLEDIQFAVEWTLKNSKEEPYDFSIITHTIGQAMAAKEKMEREKTEKLERKRIAAAEEAEKERRDREREKIEAYKETLSTEERAKLRERALEEIRKIDGVKEEFIGDILIEVKENEILKAEMGK